MKITVQADGETVYDVEELRKITGLNINKIYELLRYERFPLPIKVRNKNFWKKSDIDNYLETKRKTGD